MVARLILILSAGMFAAFGVALLLAPDKLSDWLGIAATRAEARTELRAFYGGLEIGLAVFLLACALHQPWRAA